MATTYRDNGRTLYSGTEAERLAYTIETSDTYEKNVFWIEPNGNEFRVIEGAWVQIKAAGAALTSPVSSTGVSQGYIGDSAKVTEASYVIAITPSDATVYDPPLLALRVGTAAGDVAVVSNGVTTVIPSVQLYESFRGEITQVLATGTTATGITGWQAKS